MVKRSRKKVVESKKKIKLLSGSKKYVANMKAFAISFVTLMVIDIVLFVVAGGNVERNYLFIVMTNMFLAGALQFLYIRFGKKGLYAVEIIVAIILIFTIVELMLYKTYGIFMPLGSAINNAQHVTENYSNELLEVVANNMTFIIRFVIFYAAFLVTSNEYLIKNQELKIFSDRPKGEQEIQYAVLIASFVLFVASLFFIDTTNDFTYNVQKNGVKAAFVKNFSKSSENIKITIYKCSCTNSEGRYFREV